MGCSVSARASPPSVRITKTCRVRSCPSPAERRNATQRPSGDQRAPESPSSPVKRRASVPSAFTIQSEVMRSFSSQSSSERENSTRSPSGDMRGSDTRARLMASSMPKGVCAAADVAARDASEKAMIQSGEDCLILKPYMFPTYRKSDRIRLADPLTRGRNGTLPTSRRCCQYARGGIRAASA